MPPTSKPKKPVAKKPVAKKPVAKKPVAKKPVAKKPVAKKRVVRRLPLSGSEYPYEHSPWHKYKMANNCYAYAFHDKRSWRPQKSVPGDRTNGISHNFTYCKGRIAKKIVEDNPGKVFIANASQRCPKGFYKVMMVVAPTDRHGGPGGDFHFYKQHGIIKYKLRSGDTPSNMAKFFDVPVGRINGALKNKRGNIITFKCNIFSHKMGWATGPLLVGSDGKIIKDPRYAGRKYGLNYSKYCSSFCVASNKSVKVGVV